MAEMNHDDPFAFIIELCHVSSSQEELLRRCTFLGESLNSDHQAPPCSAGIVMVSLSETQDGGKDGAGPQGVFHAPPEKSSMSMAFDHCTVNHAVDVNVDVDDGALGFVDLRGDSEGTEFVDFGKESDLGFLEGIDSEAVAECSRGIKGNGVREISKCQFNNFGVLERELSLNDGLGELPLKKLKLSEQNSGFDSSRVCFGIESQEVEEGMGNCEGNFGADLQPQENVVPGEQIYVDNACGEISLEKNLVENTAGSAGNSKFCEVDKSPCTVEGNESSDEAMETSEREKRSDEPPGLLVNAAKELESGKGQHKDKNSIFDVLKILKENSDEDGLENVSLLEAFKIRGMTFPRPRWWPNNGNYRKQGIV